MYHGTLLEGIENVDFEAGERILLLLSQHHKTNFPVATEFNIINPCPVQIYL
jgi:hypothetical protein